MRNVKGLVFVASLLLLVVVAIIPGNAQTKKRVIQLSGVVLEEDSVSGHPCLVFTFMCQKRAGERPPMEWAFFPCLFWKTMKSSLVQ